MEPTKVTCPDCDAAERLEFNRRHFLKVVSSTAAAAASASLPLWATPKVEAAATPESPAETAVKALYGTLNDAQRKAICFPWEYQDKTRGLLRTHVSNNWQITEPHICSDFYTKEQQHLIHDIFKEIINPEWYGRFVKQLKDDTGGQPWGAEQSIAIFGKPGGGKFEFVMTGRHMTIRADGHSRQHVAFGGPIFYGHAASGFREKVGHPGNVFWYQAKMANIVYEMLDSKQQKEALLARRPQESAVEFHGAKARHPGIPVSEFSSDQKDELEHVLKALIEPYRKEDGTEALACLKRQGGLDVCSLAFYKEGDLGNDGEWDNWRLEGPAFVWYFRGTPHVHVWVNVGDDPALPLNAKG
ncbi:MAG TPA: DUF3500 domain-containing protein [Gemmataceae bacterium]|nr:DUF3500 domain-containing protein [Gemmataceae bacterium]